MIAAVKIGGSSEQMHLHHGKFRWPWPCADAILRASSNGAHRGLHSKPLEAAIGRLLAVYCPGGRQGDNQLNDSETCTQFVGRLMAIAMRRYYTARIARWRRLVAS